MTWKGDPRTSTSQWRKLRLKVLARDRMICHVCGRVGADEVDHVDGNHMNNALSNLAAIHDNPCHRVKSAREGGRASALERARIAGLRKRAPEPHPGFKV